MIKGMRQWMFGTAIAILASAAPVNSVAPVISGIPVVNATLSATTGTWSGSGISYTYQWQRGGVDIASATASTYQLVSGDSGATVTCIVTATNGSGAANATSNTSPTIVTVSTPVMASSGTAGSSLSTLTPSAPSGITTGDLLVIWAETSNEAVTIPSGWTELPSSPQGTGTASSVNDATRLTIMYRIAQANGEAMPTIADPGDHIIGRCLRFTGHSTTTPFDATSGDVEPTIVTGVTIPGLTTTYPQCFVAGGVTYGRDSSTQTVSSQANASLSSLTLQQSGGTAGFWGAVSTTGNGGGAHFITGVKAVPGVVDPTTCTESVATVQGRIMFAIRPDGPAAF